MLKKEAGEPQTGELVFLSTLTRLEADTLNSNKTVGAENAPPSMLDGLKEEKRGASQTSAR